MQPSLTSPPATHSKWSINHLCRAVEENGSHSHHERLNNPAPCSRRSLLHHAFKLFYSEIPLSGSIGGEYIFQDSGLNKTTLQRWSCEFNNVLKINSFICIRRATLHLWAVWLCILSTDGAGRARQQRQHTKVSPTQPPACALLSQNTF